MRWFERARIEWIVETITIYGYMNRDHVCAKFGVTHATAAKDFQSVLSEFPGLMIYDRVNKKYVLCEDKPNADRCD